MPTVAELLKLSGVQVSHRGRCELGRIVADTAREDKVPHKMTESIEDGKKYQVNLYPVFYTKKIEDLIIQYLTNNAR